MLFIASHIKRHADSTIYEKYDTNNGLLLCANADALFDKYMITISEDKNIIFSELLKDEVELKKNLLLDHEIISKHILNEQRMKYMEDHRAKFYEKEAERIDKATNVQAIKSTISKVPDPSSSIQLQKSININHQDIIGKFMDNVSLIKPIVAVPYENLLHKKWIIKNKMFNTHLESKEFINVTHTIHPEVIIIYDKGNPNAFTAYNILSSKWLTDKQMNGYPIEVKKGCEYLVYAFGENVDIKLELDALIQKIGMNNNDSIIARTIYIK
jgi:hypothetical protein